MNDAENKKNASKRQFHKKLKLKSHRGRQIDFCLDSYDWH